MMQSGDIGDLAGRLLLAMPDLHDPQFHHAVIAIILHDADGTLGLVLNDVAEFDVAQVVAGEEFQDSVALRRPALIGGPVQQDRGFMLHSTDWTGPDTLRATDRLAMSTSIEVLHDIAAGKGPRHWWLAMGYAGWGAGQLEAEIAENAWHITASDTASLFTDERADLWQRILQRDGLDPAKLLGMGGYA